jgi:hypothetical protein
MRKPVPSWQKERACFYFNPPSQGITAMIGKASPLSPEPRGTFRMIPDVMWSDERLKDYDLRLWCVLGWYARGRDHCEPTDASIAATMSVSVATVKRGLMRLEAAGFLERRHDDRDNRSIFLSTQDSGDTPQVFRLRVAQK